MDKVINIFGNSIAWGACDNEMGGWANRLRNYLANEAGAYFETYNLGVSGDNSDKLLKRFPIENEARDPDIIMIAIGLNDSQHINSKDSLGVPLERFENNLLELIKQAKKFTEKIVFVGLTKVDEAKTMPIIWDTDKYYYDNENIARYNAKIKEICEKNSLPFIAMLDLLSDEDLEDGLHPNSQGHEKMFLRIKYFLIANKII